jgi:hypothetical protein
MWTSRPSRNSNLTHLREVRKCRRTTYPTIERARQVIWLMTVKGVDTGRLRPIACNDCRQFHIEYVKDYR